ncbi:hypothetical protein PPYR_12735 [Photinus pyralis]|uniref:Ketimine reductase mu-crystallin n=1 Tax=Photinus pyralis TaxID=7054 RepID=A0A5N4A730_PHOPY|nr:ketimine reductase mu-crystallin-like [Photinus pyralis]KAB0793115.1 hypothetical protein PPYR_12735 [Photinus pyralis]
MPSLVQISEEDVRGLLKWDHTFKAVECALEGVTRGWVSQTSQWMSLGQTENIMIILPGYLNHEKYGGIAYKFFTIFPSNDRPMFTHIALMNENSGEIKAMIFGNDITEWRTAAASVVATKHLIGARPQKILAICGAGAEGRAHAVAFQHFFNYEQVRIWNRTPSRAQKLVEALNHNLSQPIFLAAETVEECLKNADVIVTATPGDDVIVQLKWVKPGAHINAIGVSSTGTELDIPTYKAGHVYVDSIENVKHRLQHLQAHGIQFKAQIGDLITKSAVPPESTEITIFQSLGMGSEDCAMARMIYDLHMNKFKTAS